MFTCEPLPVAPQRNLRIPIIMVNETSGFPNFSGMVIDGLLLGVWLSWLLVIDCPFL
jgi:hypothetical protein